MSLKLKTAPTEEPIALDEAKAHLRVDVNDEDALITALIVAARQGAEHITGRSFMPQTWELGTDGFYDEKRRERSDSPLILPRPPLISITSVTYIDQAGTQQTLAPSAYLLDDFDLPARIVPVYGTCWPATRCQPNSVIVEYQAGYENAAAVPQQIKQWMLLQIGAMYANRESVADVPNIVELPFADRLLDAYRVWEA